MNNSKRVVAFLCSILLPACNLPFPLSPSPSFAPTRTDSPLAAAPAEPSITSIPPLTAEILRNATYDLPQMGRTATLKNGEYHSPFETDPVNVRLLDQIAFGEFNGDGARDAAVLLSENSGGTGIFVSLLAVLNESGRPVQSHDLFIDDRPVIHDLSFADGRITLDAVVHTPIRPLCCPDFPVTRVYLWTAVGLPLVRVTSRTPADQERALDITLPVSETEVSGSVRVQGTITIAPFENTLVYRIYDADEHRLMEGPLMVDAADIGAPGTFDHTIDLAGAPAGARIRLEILDISAADGSILTMNSVYLLVAAG